MPNRLLLLKFAEHIVSLRMCVHVFEQVYECGWITSEKTVCAQSHGTEWSFHFSMYTFSFRKVNHKEIKKKKVKMTVK